MLTASVIVLLAWSAAEGARPAATAFVVQPEDTAGTALQLREGPLVTANDGAATIATQRRQRLSGGYAFYADSGADAAGDLAFLSSRAIVYRDAAIAHRAFLTLRDGLTTKHDKQGSAVAIGQEGRLYAASEPAGGPPTLFSTLLWRHGPVLAYIETGGGRTADALRFGRRQQARIASRVPAVVKPVIGDPVSRPGRPDAGERFTVVFRIVRSDIGEPMPKAAVSSTIGIAGKRVEHEQRFRRGVLAVSVAVPETASRKRLTVFVKANAEGHLATKTASYTIR
jgi:hypothetical protein